MSDTNETLRERLQQLADIIGTEEVNGVADVALVEIPKKLTQIQAGLDANDLEGVSRLAHALKGDTGTLGIDDMADTARTLEGVADPANGVDGPGLLAELRTLYQSAEPILREFATP